MFGAASVDTSIQHPKQRTSTGAGRKLDARKIPAELRAHKQWVSWRFAPPAKPGGKPRKILYTPGTDRRASSTNPATWGTLEAANADVTAGRADGIGFVFTEKDPYFGIDLDDCRDPETGAVEPWALATVERFATYTEPSPSGTGLHIIGRGVKPGRDCRKGAQIECYDTARYFTFTAAPLPGHEAIASRQNVLTAWHRETWPQPELARRTPSGPAPDSAQASDDDRLSDDEIIEKLSNHPTKGAAFRDLYAGGLLEFPSASEARYSLIARIAGFWTDDAAQVERILRRSDQWTDKCEKRPELPRSEIRAILDSYTGPRYARTRQEPEPDKTATEAPPIMGADTPELAERLAELEAQVSRQAAANRELRAALREIEAILAYPDMEAGPRLTAIGTCLEIHEQHRRGRKPSEHGYKVLASWIARRTGQTPKTVNTHFGKLSKAGIIDRHTVTEYTTGDLVDTDSGEIVGTERTPRKIGYIRSEPAAIVTNLQAYRREKEAPRHGGTRIPAPHCPKHPDAGTVTHTVIECRECGDVVHRGRTEQEPEEIFKPTPQDGVSAATASRNDRESDGIPKMGYSSPHCESSLTQDGYSVVDGPRAVPNTQDGYSARLPLDSEPEPDSEADYQPRRCKGCRAILAAGEPDLCPDCAAHFAERERKQAERHRERMRDGLILGRKRCAARSDCSEYALPGSLYCREHGGHARDTDRAAS